MPPKRQKNKKRNSVVQIPKENGDVDSSLNSPAVETPMSENQEFITPADRLDNPLDAPIANGVTDSIDDKGKEGTDETMAKAEGDEVAAAWGLDDDKGKGVVGEPEAIPDTAEKLENGFADHKPEGAEVNGEHNPEESKVEDSKDKEPKDEEPKVEELKDEEPKAEGPKDEEPKDEEPKDEGPKDEEPKDEEPKSDEFKDEEVKAEDTEPKAEEPHAEEPHAEEPHAEEPHAEEPHAEEPHAEEPKTEELESKPEELKDDVPDTKAEEPSEEDNKPVAHVDLDVPDTADAREYIPEEHFAEKAAREPVTDESTADKAEEPQPEKLAEEEHAAEKAAEEEPVGEQPPTEENPEAPALEEAAAVGEAPAGEAASAEKTEGPETTAGEPEAIQDALAPEATITGAAPDGDAVPEEKTAPEGETAPEVEAAPDAEAAPEVTAEATPEEPVVQRRPIMDAPKPATLDSLTSTDRDFTSTRYQSTTSPQFLNKPRQPANHSLDLDDRNMQSSVNNWYKKLFSFADSLNWRPGWEYLEEFDYFVKSIEAPLSQVSLAPAQEWWAEKPKDPSIDWDKIDEAGAKYEEFWEWKSKIALSAICANFACREILGKTVFGLDAQMTKKLGLAMSVFTKDFGDDITATKFRHMTLKLLQESKSFGSSSRKQLVRLSQELANVLSPLSSLLPVKEPQTEEEKQQQEHYSPMTLALYEKVLFATHTLHDTIQKDHKYFALFHPVPGATFDETTMEESTFQGIGAGKGAVVLIARPGLARLGLPRGGEPEDIVIVHKALVVREDALEEALKHFDPPASEAPPAAPAEEDPVQTD